MQVAFHFDLDQLDGQGIWRFEEAVLRGLAAVSGTRPLHALVSMGDPPTDRVRWGLHVNELACLLLRERYGLWSTFTEEELSLALSRSDLAVACIEGLTASQAADLHAAMREQVGANYLGSLQVLVGSDVHRALYSNLPRKYRVFRDELRVLHTEWEVAAEDERDHQKFERWRHLRLFRRVVWENMGVKDTVLDPWLGKDHARLIGELEDLLIEQASEVPNEVLLRASALNPQLVEALHAALHRYSRWKNAEDLAQAALSCRRFLEHLADCVFEPRDEPFEGRDVSQGKYRNRLWAYVKQELASGSEQDMVLATLEDIGRRVDRLDSMANKGLHATVRDAEIHRLFFGLTALAYDLLTLAVPPIVHPLSPYQQHVTDTVRRHVEAGEEVGDGS